MANIIDPIELNIGIKTNLKVDDKTFYTCLKLLNIYGLQENLKGMVLRFDDDPINAFSGPVVQVLKTDEEASRAMYSPFKED